MKTQTSQYTPTAKEMIDDLLNDPGVHTLTKQAIRLGLSKDPVDAYYDLELATEAMKRRMEEMTRS